MGTLKGIPQFPSSMSEGTREPQGSTWSGDTACAGQVVVPGLGAAAQLVQGHSMSYPLEHKQRGQSARASAAAADHRRVETTASADALVVMVVVILSVYSFGVCICAF